MNTIDSRNSVRRPRRRPRRCPRRRRCGFTLIELLVVIAIIVLLAGLLLPVLYKTYRSANRTRLSADLNTISVALDAYRSDFGDYPRPPSPGTGFAVLGKALIGPFDASASLPPPPQNGKAGSVAQNGGTFTTQFVALRDTTTTPPGADWAQFAFSDGADGPGFRTRAQGKVTPPYLPADKFKRQGLALLDHVGNPILYFPASPVKVNLNQPGALYVSSAALIAGGGPAMYNFDDNGTLAMSLSPIPDAAKSLARMQALMGVRKNGIAQGSQANGQLLAGEAARTTQPFILWSVGPDGIFGPLEEIDQIRTDPTLVEKAVRSCDDVANFSFTQ